MRTEFQEQTLDKDGSMHWEVRRDGEEGRERESAGKEAGVLSVTAGEAKSDEGGWHPTDAPVHLTAVSTQPDTGCKGWLKQVKT